MRSYRPVDSNADTPVRCSTLESSLRAFACFGALAVYGTLAFVILFLPGGRNFLIWHWMPLWARTNLWFLGIRLDVRGREHLTSRVPCIFVSNHQGLLDIFSVPTVLRGLPMFYVVKSEFRLYPFIGQLSIFTRQVFVRRDANGNYRSMLAQAAQKLGGGMCTVMFPEGRRRSELGLQPFKMGTFWLARETGLPLVPLTLVNSWELLPHRTWRLTKGTLRIVVDAPIDTSGWKADDLPSHVAQVRALMLSNLGLPPENVSA